MLNAIPKKTLLIAIALFFTVLSAGSARANAASGSSVYIGPDWCAVGGSVNIRWQIDGGAPPYTVSVAGIVAETDEEHLTLSCADLRAWVTDGVLFRSVEVAVPVRVAAANEVDAVAERTILLLASAPQIEVSEMSLIGGHTDLHVYPRPWPYLSPAGESTPPIVAIFRYRAVGAVDWIYAMPFPPPPQSSSYSLASHVGDLDPETEYELQAAWLWHGALRGSGPRNWAWISWQSAVEAGLWEDTANWWREWNDPNAVRWSKTRRFQLQQPRPLSVRATANTLHVSWLGELSEHSKYGLVVRSEDWPGVAWGDSKNLRNRYDQEAEQDVEMTAVLSGLPPDSTFEVTVLRALPEGFAPAPIVTARVRTLPAPNGLPPGEVDPRGFVVTAGARDVRVQLLARDERFGTGSFALVALQRLVDGQPPQGRLGWAREPDHQRELPGGGTEFVFTGLLRNSTWRVYVNLWPSWGDSSPFVCAIYDIQLASRPPHEWLDHYLHSPVRSVSSTVSPVDLPQVTFTYTPYCTLRHASGE